MIETIEFKRELFKFKKEKKFNIQDLNNVDVIFKELASDSAAVQSYVVVISFNDGKKYSIYDALSNYSANSLKEKIINFLDKPSFNKE